MASNKFYARNGLNVADVLTVESASGNTAISGTLAVNSTVSFANGGQTGNSTVWQVFGNIWTGTNANVTITPNLISLGNSTVNTVINFSSANSIVINGLTVGYLETPINSQSAAYTTVLSDSGKSVFHPSGDNNARTFTIANNSSVAYPIGTTLTFINAANVVTIAINNDTLNLMGYASNTGSRSLTAYGMATAVKVAATAWVISGINLT